MCGVWTREQQPPHPPISYSRGRCSVGRGNSGGNRFPLLLPLDCYFHFFSCARAGVWGHEVGRRRVLKRAKWVDCFPFLSFARICGTKTRWRGTRSHVWISAVASLPRAGKHVWWRCCRRGRPARGGSPPRATTTARAPWSLATARGTAADALTAARSLHVPHTQCPCGPHMRTCGPHTPTRRGGGGGDGGACPHESWGWHEPRSGHPYVAWSVALWWGGCRHSSYVLCVRRRQGEV